jgi:hypothetical protein
MKLDGVPRGSHTAENAARSNGISRTALRLLSRSFAAKNSFSSAQPKIASIALQQECKAHRAALKAAQRKAAKQFHGVLTVPLLRKARRQPEGVAKRNCFESAANDTLDRYAR